MGANRACAAMVRQARFRRVKRTVKGRFMRARLKLFVDEDKLPKDESTTAAMTLEEFARVISDAVTWDRTWLQDFAEEHIVVSQDLYEIVRMYDDVHQVRA